MEHAENILCESFSCEQCNKARREFHEMCLKEIQKEIDLEIIRAFAWTQPRKDD